jgi:hypothetical protein
MSIQVLLVKPRNLKLIQYIITLILKKYILFFLKKLNHIFIGNSDNF